MYKAPIPLGPYILWLDILIMSIPKSFTSMFIFANAWTASVWNSTLCFFAISAISLIGSTVPISLFANIIVIKTVVSFIAFSSSSRLILPSSSTSRYVTSNPCLFSRYSHVWRTAWCSIFDVIIWFPFSFNFKAAPSIAQLSLSEPPAVKYISEASAFIKLATCSLAFSRPALASSPNE